MNKPDEEVSKIDDGTALALFIEIGSFLDPNLTEDDKHIVFNTIKNRLKTHIRDRSTES